MVYTMTDNETTADETLHTAKALAKRFLNEIIEEWAADPEAVGDTHADIRNWFRDKADALETEPIRVYGIERLSQDDHNWGDWEPSQYDLIYATREDAQKCVDSYAEGIRKRKIAAIVSGQKERLTRWTEHNALAELGLRVPSNQPKPEVWTQAQADAYVLSEHEIGYRVTEIEVED